MKKLTLLLFAMLTICSASAQETVKLTVSGQGATKEEATVNALRSAIEQSFGVFVSANTQILNDEVVKDEIATVASGNIQEYKELGCITMPNGKQSVTLSATVSIGNLISYAKSKGSSAEFAGQVFAMNIKMRKLNAENEKKAVEHLINQLEILAPDLFKIEISITESPIRKHMSVRTLKTLNFSVEPAVNYYLIPIKFNYYSSETSKAFHSVLLNTLQSLALSQSEIEEYRNSNEPIYTYYQDTWKKLGLGGLDLAFRTSFIPYLISFLDRVYRVALFCSYNLDIVGLNESYRFYNDSKGRGTIKLDGRPIYYKGDIGYEEGYYVEFEDYYGRSLLDFQNFNTIGFLVKTEKIHVLFTEEECSKIRSIEMKNNNDDFLHSITLYDIDYKAYKAFTQNQHVFTFKKHSNQIEFASSRYEKNGQTFNETTRIIFDLKSRSWNFGVLGSINHSFYDSYYGKFEYGESPNYYDILLKQYSNSDNYYLYVERLGEDKSEYYFHIPNGMFTE